MKTSVALIALFTIVGCGAVRVAGTPLTAAMRFPSADSVAVSTDSATAPRTPPCPSPSCVPNYPAELSSREIQGDLAVVFVIDARGRVEMPSASFIRDTPHALFRRAICAFLLDARFEYPPGVQPRRTFVAMPFAFYTRPRPALLDVKEIEDWLTQTPRSLVIERLHSLNHCV